ncbi:hypothetical protein [Fusobacterium necrophorum]|uniref:Uncharacterized protein n=1 Tax=Fusobacterium necrophorum subsp. funduliforme TaxID=143387 RepID=A0A162J8K4_9FUSO|nr:hypothetical protein [Fusobacterium necrophorum]KYL05337.1 hypothetical protein A2J07_00955 [Fusobacterium necrophorum subsp. funduliforme]
MIEQIEVFHKETIPKKYIEQFETFNKNKYNLLERNKLYKELFYAFLEEYPDSNINFLEFKNHISKKDTETVSLKEIELDFLTGAIDEFEFYTNVEFTEKYLLLNMEQAIKTLEQNSHVWFKEDDIYDYLQRKFSNLDVYELYVKYVLYCDIVHCKPLVNNPELLYKIFHDKFSVEYKEYARKLKRLYSPDALPITENQIDLSFSTTLSDVEMNRIILNKVFYQNPHTEEEYWELFAKECKENGFKIVFSKQEFHNLYLAFKTTTYQDLADVYTNKLVVLEFNKHQQEMMIKHCYKMYEDDCHENGITAKTYNEFKVIALNKLREVSK